MLFDDAADAVVVVGADGRIVLANHACERLLGWSVEALIGQRVERLVPPRFSGHSEHRRGFAESPNARPMGRGILLWAQHADGHEIPVDISLTPVHAGGQRYTAASLRDLRDRAHGDARMRLQATALQSAANGIVMTNREGIITWVNPSACAITGYSASELVGQHTRLLKSGVHDRAFYAAIWETISRGEIWSGIIVNRRKDGTHYHEEQTIAPVVDEEGSVTHFVAIKQDVTERVRATEQLAAAHDELERQNAALAKLDALKTRFVANISHELRTPLSVVIGTLDHAISGGARGKMGKALERAARNAERLGQLIDQLLDEASLEAGGARLRARRVDLRDALGRIVRRFQGAAEQARVELSLSEGRDPIFLWLDPEHLDKIASNLLSNALKFTPAGGEVHVEMRVDDRFARVEVVDTGVGVDPVELPRLFQRFYQADSGDARSYEGMGIGLHLARELVELHGGDIGAQSTPGKGSTFWFTMPLGADHIGADDVDLAAGAAGTADEVNAAPASRSSGRPRALVVEDHADMRAWLAEQLEHAFEVRTAADGRQALERLQEQRPDVLVSDVMMPGMDGITLARAMRADPALAEVPILLVSAKGSSDDEAAGLTVADDYLTKPFTVSALMDRVQRLVPSLASRLPRPGGAASTEMLPAHDAELLARLEASVHEHLADQSFCLDDLAREVGMSRRSTQREISRLTSCSFKAILRNARLAEAQRLLEAGVYRTVSEVAAAVGMSPSHFRRVYQSFFGRAPSEALRAT